jgi:hypothetical protein
MTTVTIERTPLTAASRKLKDTWEIVTVSDWDFSNMRIMKPKDLLLHLHNQKLQYRTYGRDTVEKADPDGEIMKTIQETMQANYPGPYIVEEFYDTKRMSFALRLKFNSPQEETMWTIKNS